MSNISIAQHRQYMEHGFTTIIVCLLPNVLKVKLEDLCLLQVVGRSFRCI